MKRLNDLEFLKLNKFQAFWYKVGLFFCAIPGWLVGVISAIGAFFVRCFLAVKNEIVDIATTFTQGNKAVKLSFFLFGAGNLFYGQTLRGLGFLLFEVVFLFYMFFPLNGILNGFVLPAAGEGVLGWVKWIFGGEWCVGTGRYWLEKGNWFKVGSTVGTEQGHNEYNAIFDTDVWVAGDDSVKVMLYGLLTIIFIIAFIWTWRLQVKQCRICMDITAQGKKVKSGKDDLKSLLDDQFHKTLLALPLSGILLFTVLPIIYMVLIAFTNYDAAHDGYSNLFSWVGFEHFNELFSFGRGGLGLAFGEILSWTLMWAFFATFTNYFLGMFVAIMINKKGIRLKKFWRTVLVMTIAIPQFVSLMYVAKLFDGSGIVYNGILNMPSIADIFEFFKFDLESAGAFGEFIKGIPTIGDTLSNYLQSNHYISMWDSPVLARIMVIVINIWIGIPYIMLMATGILMNIPQDLYESARIDGASGIQQYTKITLPYMMFVMGPYLLTSFVGNLNNFNVIYLLTGGNPLNTEIGTAGGVSIGHTDLLITWLYKMTLNSPESQYYYGSLIGILVFVVVAALSLVVYNIIPSTKNEEDFR